MEFVGIDPGKKGGIAIIDGKDIKAEPFSEAGFVNILSNIKDGFCVVEKVGAMPGQGVVSMFSFGQNFGFIQGVLQAYKIPYELVTPQKWKKEFSVTKDKNTSIEVVKRLFPDANLKASERSRKDHDGMAEALLMAEYGRRHYAK